MLGRRIEPEPRADGVRVCSALSARRMTPDPDAGATAITPSERDCDELCCANAGTDSRTIAASNTTRFIDLPPCRPGPYTRQEPLRDRVTGAPRSAPACVATVRKRSSAVLAPARADRAARASDCRTRSARLPGF